METRLMAGSSSIDPDGPLARAIARLQASGHTLEAQAVQRLILERVLFREEAAFAHARFNALMLRIRTPA